MKVTVIECDSCAARIEHPHTPELCDECSIGGLVELRGVPYREWPALLTKESVRLILEGRDKTEADLRDEIKKGDRERRDLFRDLNRTRARAAHGLGEPDLAEALRDIASGSDREEARSHA